MHSFKIAINILIIFGLTGCVTNGNKNPHNDVLIFGTSTKFALDVSASVQNAGLPEFTLGYKRLEAVWMPLKPRGHSTSSEIDELINELNDCQDKLNEFIPNKLNLKKECLRLSLPVGKYVSLSSSSNSKTGDSSADIDTYSVFASLGAKGSLGSSASGNVTQFFATGIAAQRLASNPQIGLALNTNSPDVVGKTEEAKAEKSKEIQALLEAGATPEQAMKHATGTKERISKRSNEITVAIACISAWKAIPPVNLTNANAIAIINSYQSSNKNLDFLKSDLEGDGVARRAIITECNN